MKKSPLSTPNAHSVKQKYGWKSYENNRTGYGAVNSDNYPRYSLNGSDMNYANDFIPLNMSSPVSEQNRHSGNWYNNGGRNYRNSCGFYNHRNNYHMTQKSHFNNSYSPYKSMGNKQFHGQKKIYQKGTHRQVDISRYIDIKSCLEDPWADLTKKLNISKESMEKTDSMNMSLSSSTLESKEDSKINISINITHEDSMHSQNTITDSLVDSSVTDDTDSTPVSRTDNSVDLKTDDSKSNKSTNNEYLSSIVNSSSGCIIEELCGSPQTPSIDMSQQSI